MSSCAVFSHLLSLQVTDPLLKLDILVFHVSPVPETTCPQQCRAVFCLCLISHFSKYPKTQWVYIQMTNPSSGCRTYDSCLLGLKQRRKQCDVIIDQQSLQRDEFWVEGRFNKTTDFDTGDCCWFPISYRCSTLTAVVSKCNQVTIVKMLRKVP